jgi:hypothetical protein
MSAANNTAGFVVVNRAEGNSHVGDTVYPTLETALAEAARLNTKKSTTRYTAHRIA